MRFWYDLKWDSIPLNIAFPMMFALANNKDGMVKDFGSFVGSKWNWEIGLRRELFDWEIDQWNSFLLSLDCFIIHEDIQDAMTWSFNSNGLFLVKSFRRWLENTRGGNDQSVCLFLWKGICPPKVEVFLW